LHQALVSELKYAGQSAQKQESAGYWNAISRVIEFLRQVPVPILVIRVSAPDSFSSSSTFIADPLGDFGREGMAAVE
jgi:hypothetical protein